LTGRIKLILRSEGYENLRGINVNVTPQGYVHLTGHVTSEEEKARAEEIIRSIEGVDEVINELTLLEFTPPMAPY
jgi:osmotically-inducible protein OsmY